MVPVRGLDRGHEVRDAGAVLADAHRDLAGGAGVPVAHEAGVALVGDVPEGDPGLREEIRNRHEGGADDAEHVLDAVALQHLHEGFFSRHSHGDSPHSFPFPSRALARLPVGGGCYHPRGPDRPAARTPRRYRRNEAGRGRVFLPGKCAQTTGRFPGQFEPGADAAKPRRASSPASRMARAAALRHRRRKRVSRVPPRRPGGLRQTPRRGG